MLKRRQRSRASHRGKALLNQPARARWFIVTSGCIRIISTMKRIYIHFAALLTFLSAMSAADSIPVESLPSTIFMIRESAVVLHPEQSKLHSSWRDTKESIPAFSTEEKALKFIHATGNPQSSTWTPLSFRKADLTQFLDSGVVVLFDPLSDTEGGSIISSGSTKKAKDNEELQKLFSEDQSDRLTSGNKAIDWAVVAPRDATRKARVLELLEKHQIRTGSDYLNSAFILQHGQTPEDFILAHEFCIIAVARGKTEALWLAAASEDRFLIKIGRKQRFGTQLGSSITTDGQLSDDFRSAFHVPSLEESKKMAETILK